MKRAVKSYSFMAINCFLATLGGIAALLCILLVTEDFEDSTAITMQNAVYIILALCAIYGAYRWNDRRKEEAASRRQPAE